MKNSLLLILFALTLIACSSDEDEKDNPSSNSSCNPLYELCGDDPYYTPSSNSNSGTKLRIKNESSYDIKDVVWNNVSFGEIKKGFSIEESVNAGSGYIRFTRTADELKIRTNAVYVIEQGEQREETIQNTTLVIEIDNDNRAVLGSIKKIQAPKAEKASVTDTSYTSAKLSSRIIDIGNPEFTERGFCYSRYLAELELNVNCSAAEGGDFSKTINGLDDSVKYYVKAYMENNMHGRQFSEPDSFVTKSGMPIVSLPIVSSVSYNTASVQSNIVFAGYPSYMDNGGERGFCYGTNSKPEKGGINSICETVTGMGSNFLLAVANLADSTTYYIRSYIENGKHRIQYSDAESFITLSGMPNVIMSGIVNATTSSVLLKGTVLNTVNPYYTEKGFCYSSTSNLPTKGTSSAICKLVEGNQRDFELELTSLQIAKNYYVRAYIENDYGMQYSDAMTFKTNIFVDDRDGREYKIKDIGNGVVWFMEDLAYNSKTKYTWTEAQTVCPSGWRLPSGADWITLDDVWETNRIDFLTISSTGWYWYWWCSNQYNSSNAYYFYVDDDDYLDLDCENKSSYNSVRCVKN